jgi:predicted tellurium resistance membrane protein TerC
MMELFTPDAVAALFQVVVIDLSLAGDNAIVVGMAAAGLPQAQRTRAILFGMTGATVLLVLFAGITTQLLRLVGLVFAGGVLLLWVCWKMWRELRWSCRARDGLPGGARIAPDRNCRRRLSIDRPGQHAAALHHLFGPRVRRSIRSAKATPFSR